MAKKRKSTGSLSEKKKFVSAKCDNSDDDGGDKIYNDMDYLDFTEENDLVSKLGKKGQFKQKSKNELEELYAVSGSSEDELPTIKQKKKKKSARGTQDSDLDLDEDAEDITENLGAWGGKRQHFYGGNPNEKHVKAKGKSADHDEADDISEAEMEETEAKLIQARQLTELDEEDFYDTFTSVIEKDKGKIEINNLQTSQSKTDLDNTVQLDLSKLSQKERTQLFHRESPEFSGIMEDFEQKLNEASTKLYPISNLISTGKLPAEGPAADYVRTRLQTIMNYCTNIAAYLMFKTRRTNLKCHPITGQLVKYRNLLDQMEPLNRLIEPQIRRILKAIKVKPKDSNKSAGLKRLKKLIKKEKENIEGSPTKMPPKQFERNALPSQSKAKGKSSKKLKILSDDTARDNDNLTIDEQKAIELYAATRKGKKRDSSTSEEEAEDDLLEGNEELGKETQLIDKQINGQNDAEGEDRRGITYQIYKNQGLAPKRNKDQRNPRVKHRHKFEKAKVRRKGQVRTLRTETKRYSGEASGINMRVKKGVKIM